MADEEAGEDEDDPEGEAAEDEEEREDQVDPDGEEQRSGNPFEFLFDNPSEPEDTKAE